MAATVSLTLLITLIPDSLGQLFCFGLQQRVECFFYAAPNQFFDLALDYFLVQLYNLFGHGLLSPFRMVCRDFILPEICKPCLLLSTFQFAKLILPYHGIEETLTYCDFPSEHWTRIRTNNVIERLNREIRRRTRVVGSFPDGNSALMLVCARLRHVAGTQWGNKKYMNMKHLEAALEDASIAG